MTNSCLSSTVLFTLAAFYKLEQVMRFPSRGSERIDEFCRVVRGRVVATAREQEGRTPHGAA